MVQNFHSKFPWIQFETNQIFTSEKLETNQPLYDFRLHLRLLINYFQLTGRLQTDSVLCSGTLISYQKTQTTTSPKTVESHTHTVNISLVLKRNVSL